MVQTVKKDSARRVQASSSVDMGVRVEFYESTSEEEGAMAWRYLSAGTTKHQNINAAAEKGSMM